MPRISVQVHISFWISVFAFFGKIPRNGIVGLYGSSTFNVFRTLHTVFNSGCTNLHSQQDCIKVPLSPCPHTTLVIYCLLMTAILTAVRWDLTAVLICISLMISDVEHLFTCLLASVRLLWKVSIQVLCQFLIWLVVFLILRYMSSLYILNVNPLSDI